MNNKSEKNLPLYGIGPVIVFGQLLIAGGAIAISYKFKWDCYEYEMLNIPLKICNLLEYLTQRDIQTKNSGVNVRYRGKHRFFKGFNEFIKEKTRRCDNDFEKIERHVFF